MKNAIIITVAVAILTLSSVYGYDHIMIEIWSKTFQKEPTSLALIDMDNDGIANDVIVGNVDNRAYVFLSDGEYIGSYEVRSSVTAVCGFSYGNDRYLNDILIGAKDGKVYATWKLDLWKTVNRRLFSGEDYTGVWWVFDETSYEEDIYSLFSLDLDYDNINEFVLVGTGAFFKKNGNVYLLNVSGDVQWSFKTNAPVKALGVADLDEDSIADNIIVGAGRTVYVLFPDGRKLWSKDLGYEISDICAGDTDGNEEKDDIIVSAGRKLYAINSDSNIVWELEFDSEIASVSSVDYNNDKVIDYYLVSSGTKIYAVSNSLNPEILWSYDTRRNITMHVSVDLDKDGISDDVYIISGNSLFAYKHEIVELPKIKVEKYVDIFGDIIRIKLKIKNTGGGDAWNIRIYDKVPENISNKTFFWHLSRIGGYKSVEIVYEVDKSAGSFVFPSAEVEYEDSYGNIYKTLSNEVSIKIGEKNVSKKEQTKKQLNEKIEESDKKSSNKAEKIKDIKKNETKKEVLLEIKRILEKQSVTEGDKFNISIVVLNKGNGKANVNVVLNLPKELEIVDGKSSISDVILGGETKTYVFSVKAKIDIKRFKDENITLPPAVVEYDGKTAETQQDILTIKPRKTKFLFMASVVFLILRYGLRFAGRKTRKKKK